MTNTTTAKEPYDLFIIGGGINGCGIARDAVGRGYSVFLAEQDDLASGTSSGSTKLIHGGLRYLEHYDFLLVRKALKEREVLWRIAPHIIHPLRFVLPHNKNLRPAWMLRLGLFLYDHIGGRKALPPTRVVDLKTDPTGTPLKTGFVKGFEYSDCQVDDARLTLLNALDARDKGATICTRQEVVSATRNDDHWTIQIRNRNTQETETVSARMIINASGPWIDRVINALAPQSEDTHIRLVQGSHIVVPRLFDHDKAYMFQNPDGRIIFAIPYQSDFTLIGTTDTDLPELPSAPGLTDEEATYLCQSASQYFDQDISTDDIVWHYSAIRPLLQDGSADAQEATRDYVLKMEQAGFLNVFGGKITTYRKLAEEALNTIDRHFGKRTQPWTGTKPLPGGDFRPDQYPTLMTSLRDKYPFLPTNLEQRLINLYGTQVHTILGQATCLNDLGPHFGAGLFALEVDHLVETEMAQSVDDILLRRTKLVLREQDIDRPALQNYLDQKREQIVQKRAVMVTKASRGGAGK